MDSSSKPKAEHVPLTPGERASVYRDARHGLVRALDALAKLRAHEVSRPWVYEWIDTVCDETESNIAALDREYR